MATRFPRWWQPTIPQRIWWSWLPGPTVLLPWPSGEVTVLAGEPGWDWTLGTVRQTFYSADPNDHYRPWLEEHVGRQGWDWQWRPRLGTTMITPGYETEDNLGDRVEVKFRHHYDRHAAMAILRWS